MSLVLSLFPGIGLLDMAFEQSGFCIVRGPDLLWGGDVRRFRPPAGVFTGVIGGPPCQAFSRLRHLVIHNGYRLAENLIPEYERCVFLAQPDWFLMENVPEAPHPCVDGYAVHTQVFDNRWCGGEQSRRRRISFGTRDGAPLHIAGEALQPAVTLPAACASGGVKPGIPTDRTVRAKFLGWKTKEALEQVKAAQGLSPEFKLPGFTVGGAIHAIGNGVPLPLGREIAAAVLRATTREEAA